MTGEILKYVENNREKNGNGFQHLLTQITRRDRIPYSAYFELTPYCNFSCKMCYAKKIGDKTIEKPLSSAKWLEYAKCAVEQGVVCIVFTGGECTLHPDFVEIYKETYKLGVKVAVMTNASLITPEIIHLFKQYPPDNVSITMYGFSRETYQKTCGVGDAFDRVISSVNELEKAGIYLTIKCTVTKDMFDDFEKIYLFAVEKKARFIHGNVLMKTREACYKECDNISIDYDEYQNTIAEICKKHGQKYQEPPIVQINNTQAIVNSGSGMRCGAGRNTYTINSKGCMQPCNTYDGYSVNIAEYGQVKAWEMICTWADSIPQLNECDICKYQSRCRRCVFIHYGDTHEFGKPSPRLCYKVQHGITD